MTAAQFYSYNRDIKKCYWYHFIIYSTWRFLSSCIIIFKEHFQFIFCSFFYRNKVFHNHSIRSTENTHHRSSGFKTNQGKRIIHYHICPLNFRSRKWVKAGFFLNYDILIVFFLDVLWKRFFLHINIVGIVKCLIRLIMCVEAPLYFLPFTDIFMHLSIFNFVFGTSAILLSHLYRQQPN